MAHISEWHCPICRTHNIGRHRCRFCADHRPAEFDPPGTAEQPPPKRNASPAIWDLVIADMQARDAVGRERYGTPLQVHNGRDALMDAYHEALDLVVYLRQAIEERAP